jgi:uncharacterized membrane protein YvbJ
MTLVTCLECGSEQDFEDAVGYCEKCGRKLPVPHKRGKETARQKMQTERHVSEVGATNIIVTAVLAIAGLAAVVTLITVIIRSQL